MQGGLLYRTNAVVVASAATIIAFSLFLGGLSEQLLLFSTLLAITIVGLMLYRLYPQRELSALPDAVEQLLLLAGDEELAHAQKQFSTTLAQAAQHNDTIFREQLRSQLRKILANAQRLAEATIDFHSTESWRAVYEELLRSPGLHLYRSVCFIESEQYWQEGPGQQSTKLNLELQDARQVRIERIAIIADHLWPDDTLFPSHSIHAWLEEQHRHGIWIRLVRESELSAEPNLIGDFGIYGNRAVGRQIADPSGNTLQFSFCFDFEKLKEAEEHWNRLKLFGVSYRELLDQQH